MCIEDKAIEKIENITRYHWGEGHTPPILAQAVDAEGLRNYGREDTKQEAVRQACQPRHKLEIIWVFNADCAKLGSRKYK